MSPDGQISAVLPVSEAEGLYPLLEPIIAALAERGEGRVPVWQTACFPLGPLSPGQRQALEQLLSEAEGEVAGTIGVPADGPVVSVRETRLPGLWRVSGAGGELLEVGDCPAAVRAAVAALPAGLDGPALAAAAPEGVATARSLVVEIAARLAALPEQIHHAPAHEIILSHLPVNAADAAFLRQTLGVGPVRLATRGHGSCRLQATAIRHLWLVGTFNSDDTLILNTLEIGDVPAAVRADQRDLADSASRLRSLSHRVLAGLA